MTFSRREWGSYLGIFSLVHLASYVLAGAVFTTLSNLPDIATLQALAFFDPYRPIGVLTILTQLLRGILLGLLFYPFYRLAVQEHRSWLVLFGPLWGLSIVGSIQPFLGSIEGVIYTETSAAAHLVFLAISGFQYGLLTIVLRQISETAGVGEGVPRDEQHKAGIVSASFGGYISRFTIVYVLVYLSAGIAFMVLQDYETVLATSESFQIFRPLDHPLVQIAPLIQFGRGAFLALCVYPVYGQVFHGNRGYLTLFAVIWGGTFLASPTIIAGLVSDLLVDGSLAEILFGTAEVTVQMIAFVTVFWLWQRRVTDAPGLVYRNVSKVVGGTSES